MKRLIAPFLERIEGWRGDRGVILLPLQSVRPALRSHAVIAGVQTGCRSLPIVESAARDARQLARLLSSEYGFRIPSADSLLIDEQASASALQQAVRKSLRKAGPDSRWLFYFSGQGVAFRRKPFLVPHGCSHAVKESCIELQWLIDQCLQSPCKETLIVLDADFAEDWDPPTFIDWLGLDQQINACVRQLVAAGADAFHTLAGDGRRSRFTSDLVQALEGWAGVHRSEDSSVPFSRLLRWLKSPLIDPGAADRNVSGVVGGNLAGTERGHFTFVPNARHSRRIPSQWVREIRSPQADRRCHGLAWLKGQALRWKAQQEAQLEGKGSEQEGQEGFRPNLPLAVRLACRGLPSQRLEDVVTGRQCASWTEKAEQVREQAAQTLGTLSRLEEAAPQVIDPLLHLAILDPAAPVRFEALCSLKQVEPATQLETAIRLNSLEKQSGGRTARRLRLALACLPGSRRDDGVGRRLLDQGLRIQLLGGRAGLRVWSDPRLKALAFALAGSPLLLSAVLLGSAHLSSAIEPNLRDSQVVLRSGLPGFSFFPFVGNVAVETDYQLSQLQNPQPIEQGEIWESRLCSLFGMHNWGLLLARHLPAELAALEQWWMGDEGRARRILMPPDQSLQLSSVRSLVYLAIHSDEALSHALEKLPASLQASPNPRIVIEALERLADARWEDVQGALADLRQRLKQGGSPDEIALCEAAAALGRHDTSSLALVLRRAFQLLENAPDEQQEQRLIELLQRILSQRPELARQSFPDLVGAWGRVSAARRADVMKLLERSPPRDAEQASQAALLLADLLRHSDQPAQRVAALRLVAEWMAQDASWVAIYRSILQKGLQDEHRSVIESAIDAVLSLPLEEGDGLRREAAQRLSGLLRSNHLASPSQVTRRLEKLTDSTTSAASLSALLHACSQRDRSLRAAALGALGRLALRGAISPQSVRSALRSGLEDEDEWVRQEATESLLLLAGQIDDAALDESQIADNLDFLRWPGRGNASGFADRFSLASPKAASLAVRSILEAHDLEFGFGIERGEFLNRLVQVRPEVFADYLQMVTDRLMHDYRESRRQYAWESIHQAQALPLQFRQRGLDGLMLRLKSSIPAERWAAAEMIGFLIVECPDLIARVFPHLAGLMNDPAQEVAVSVARTLEAVASLPGWEPSSIELLLEGLRSRQPSIREACARSLSRIPPKTGQRVPAARVALRLADALGDSIDEVRRRAAMALSLWGLKVESPLAAQISHTLSDCLESEREDAVRIEMASALGVLSQDPQTVRRALSIGEEYRDSALESLQMARTSLLWRLGEAHEGVRQEVIHLLGDAPFEDLSLPNQDRIGALKRLGMLDAKSARAAVKALTAYQQNSSTSVWQFMVLNGIRTLLREQPTSAPLALKASHQALQQEKALRLRASREGYLWIDWVEAAAAAALQDDGPVWASLVRADDRKERNAARRALLRVVALHPDTTVQILQKATRLMQSSRPEVRRSAAQLADLIALLQRIRPGLSDRAFRRRWERVLSWFPHVPGVEELQTLINSKERQTENGKGRNGIREG